MDRSQSGEMAIPNSASAKYISSHNHLVFKDTHGFPLLEQHPAAQNATCSFCCTKQKAAATPVFVLCDLATKTNELKCTDHGGYLYICAPQLDRVALWIYTLLTPSLRCRLQSLLQRLPLPPKLVSSKFLESMNHVATATS